jgi:DNA ligase (NAD+)
MESYEMLIGHKEDLDEVRLIQVLLELDDAYFNGEELVDDDKYDELKRYAEITFPDNGYFKAVGSTVRGAEIKHANPVGGLNQIHEGELQKSWLTKHRKKQHVVSEKLDGASATLTYVGGKLRCAATRGDGVYGKDITRHVLNIPNIPKEISSNDVFDIRGELIIRKLNFEAIKFVLLKTKGREYKNLRNTVNGLLNAKDIPDQAYCFIEFVAYDISGSKTDKTAQFDRLDEFGFQTPKYMYTTTIVEEILTNILNRFREVSYFEIDGVVGELDAYEDRKDLFPTLSDPNPNYAFKWKVGADDNLAIGHVTGVEWNISKHDLAKPVVLIEPVDINGITVKRLSGFNAAFIFNSGIGPGAQVKFTRSGDVIPHILETVVRVEPQMPDMEWEWNETEVDAIVIASTPEAHLRRLTYFFATLKVDNLKEASLSKFIEAGITDIQDIIDTPIEAWVELLGKNGEKAYNSLHSRLNSVELATLMGAWPYFGRGFGTRKSRALLLGVVDWAVCTIEEIVLVEGFSVKTAVVFLKGREKFKSFKEWLLAALNIDVIMPSTTQIEGRLTGQSFAFTGVRLKDAEAQLEKLGAIIHDGVKKGTTYLVAKDPNASSNKLEKARSQGTKVIGIDELQQIIEE